MTNKENLNKTIADLETERDMLTQKLNIFKMIAAAFAFQADDHRVKVPKAAFDALETAGKDLHTEMVEDGIWLILRPKITIINTAGKRIN